jgi:hypothetical protein
LNLKNPAAPQQAEKSNMAAKAAPRLPQENHLKKVTPNGPAPASSEKAVTPKGKKAKQPLLQQDRSRTIPDATGKEDHTRFSPGPLKAKCPAVETKAATRAEA